MSSLLDPKKIRSFLIAAFWILITILYYLSQPIKTKKNIHIDAQNSHDIIKSLENNYTFSFLDKWYMSNISKPQNGWIYIDSKTPTRLDFMQSLSSPKNKYYKSTLIPGETMPIYFIALGKKLGLNPETLFEEYIKQSSYIDGGILAESYHIPSHLKERAVVKYLLKISNKVFKKISIEETKKWNKQEWQKTLTIASIIQKEAANTKEMNKVSSVIFNRLKKNMRLQMDGTLNYGIYSHVKVTPQRIDNDQTTFNTYKHKGLPISPVCAVSKEAILAALHPLQTDFLYFTKNKHGTHSFSKNYKSHLKKINRD